MSETLTRAAAAVAADLRIAAESIPGLLAAGANPTDLLLQLAPRLKSRASELEHALDPARPAARRPVAAGDDRLWRER